jgi:hypothetical protein
MAKKYQNYENKAIGIQESQGNAAEQVPPPAKWHSQP